nr:MAG TPA: hypothetical protein [Caudoviricetes sp.]
MFCFWFWSLIFLFLWINTKNVECLLLNCFGRREDEITYPGTPIVEHPDKRSGFPFPVD